MTVATASSEQPRVHDIATDHRRAAGGRERIVRCVVARPCRPSIAFAQPLRPTHHSTLRARLLAMPSMASSPSGHEQSSKIVAAAEVTIGVAQPSHAKANDPCWRGGMGRGGEGEDNGQEREVDCVLGGVSFRRCGTSCSPRVAGLGRVGCLARQRLARIRTAGAHCCDRGPRCQSSDPMAAHETSVASLRLARSGKSGAVHVAHAGIVHAHRCEPFTAICDDALAAANERSPEAPRRRFGAGSASHRLLRATGSTGGSGCQSQRWRSTPCPRTRPGRRRRAGKSSR